MNAKELTTLLNRDDVRGAIIKDMAFLDLFMLIVVSIYFSPGRRSGEFIDLIGDRLSFNDKISILERLPLKKKYKSTECFAVIRQLQQVRNLLAHRHHIDGASTKIQNASWKSLFADYPESYKKKVQQAKRQLTRLAESKEYYIEPSDS